MARKTKKAKRDNVQEITDRIVAALEAGVAPWTCPWDRGTSGGMPRNGHTGRAYSGVNIILLWLSGHTDSRWYTYKQVSGNYGDSHVRKGEKGTKVTFWRFLEKDRKDADGKVVIGLNGKPVKDTIPMCRVFTVFNHTQIEWAGEKAPAAPVAPAAPAVAYEEAEAFFSSLDAKVIHAGGVACYSGATDSITLPPVAVFNTVPDYWATRAHETVHWTGHADRCAREFGKRFGDDAYAAEELVAEMGSAFLCATLGIEGKLQHVEYLSHWVKVLKSDKYAIFTAARKANEAATFLKEAAEAGAATAPIATLTPTTLTPTAKAA